MYTPYENTGVASVDVDHGGWPYRTESIRHGLGPKERKLISPKPAVLLASDLFTASRFRKRCFVRDQELHLVSSSRTAKFTGERFDQYDLDLFLTCLHMAMGAASQNGVILRVKTSRLLAAMGKRSNKAARDVLIGSLGRLESGLIQITDSKYSSTTRLISRLLINHDGTELILKPNAEITAIFRQTPGCESFLRERFSGGLDPIAKWLHGLTWSVKGQFLIDFDTLKSLSGLTSKGDTALRVGMLKALAELRAMGHVHHWEDRTGRRLILSRFRREDAEGKCLMLVQQSCDNCGNCAKENSKRSL
jgi:hypothetical protein